MDSPEAPRPRAAIVAVQLPDVDDGAFASSITELERLARTLGLDVVARVTQRRGALHAAAVVGSGKIAELQSVLGRRVAAEGESEEDEDEDEDEEEDGDEDGEDEDEDGEEDGKGTPTADPAAVTVVLVDHDISPSQARNLEKATGARCSTAPP